MKFLVTFLTPALARNSVLPELSFQSILTAELHIPNIKLNYFHGYLVAILKILVAPIICMHLLYYQN